LLVRAGLEACKEIGAGAVVVLGHSDYYPRFGFTAAVNFGIGCEYDVPAEAFMALELRPGYLRGASGTVKYLTAYDDFCCSSLRFHVPLWRRKARLNRGPEFLFLSLKFGYTG